MNTDRSGQSGQLLAEYVCNAGVLLQTEEGMIGIDVFARDSTGLYRDTPQKIRQEILAGAANGSLKLLLISHEHEDHYCTEDVIEALRTAEKSHNDLKVAASGAVISDLMKHGASPERILDCCRSGSGKCLRGEEGTFPGECFPGFSLSCRYAVHDGNMYRNVMNLLFLVETHGKKLLFTGDACPDKELFVMLQEWVPRIDWLFAPFPYVGKPSVRRLMGKYLNVEKIAALHFPEKQMDRQGWREGTVRICRNAADSLPEPLFLEETGTVFSLL